MIIAFPTLLRVANFPKEKVDMLVANIDYVTEEEKLGLSNTAWQLIAGKHFTLLNLRRKHILEEVAQGKRQPNSIEIEEIEETMIRDLAQKLEVASSEQGVGEVRQQLQKFRSSPYIINDFSQL